MKIENWTCVKCQYDKHKKEEVRVVGGFWSKIFNIQTKKYESIICKNCSYSEFYKKNQHLL